MKPASRTPIGALIIAEVLSSAPHLPKGAFSVLPCSRDGADLFTTDPRFKLLSFTGSPSVRTTVLYLKFHEKLSSRVAGCIEDVCLTCSKRAIRLLH
jgi:hypothetical protein